MRVLLREGPAALSVRARKAFQLAHQEAHRLNHGVVGAEHLLLGLAKEGGSPVAAMLRRCGFNIRWLRREVERRHPRGPAAVALPAKLPYTAQLGDFLDAIVAAGESSEQVPVSPEMLLLALIEQDVGTAAVVFRMRPFRRWWLRRWLRAVAQPWRSS